MFLGIAATVISEHRPLFAWCIHKCVFMFACGMKANFCDEKEKIGGTEKSQGTAIQICFLVVLVVCEYSINEYRWMLNSSSLDPIDGLAYGN